MTTVRSIEVLSIGVVVEAYRLDRYDNITIRLGITGLEVVEAYRLDRYDNLITHIDSSI